jgi:hypothetical protein
MNTCTCYVLTRSPEIIIVCLILLELKFSIKYLNI